MNYNLLVPTYVDRLITVKEVLRPARRLLNVGCGRGDYNYELKDRFDTSIGIDLNSSDIAQAKRLTKDTRTQFSVMDAAKLSFKENQFDAVICIDVLEHVKNPDAVLREIRRVLRKGGQLILSVPNRDFPFFYDPFNSILQQFGLHLPIGAYAFGHQHLPTVSKIRSLLEKNHFNVRKIKYLSHALVGFLECYHVGLWQRLFKENSNNTAVAKKSVLPYDYRIQFAFRIVRALLKLDRLMFKNSKKAWGFSLMRLRHKPAIRECNPDALGVQ